MSNTAPSEDLATDVEPHAVVVIAGGDAPTPEQFALLTEGAETPVRVVVADSGADHALALGIKVDLAVGDFDSASDAAQAWLHQTNCEIRAYRPDKNFSDFELAMEAAVESGPQSICVLGVGGGRADHSMLNLLVLASDRWASAEVEALVDGCLVTVIHSTAELTGEPGSILSLIPIGGPATVSTVGLLYPLDDEELRPTEARGLSNVMAADTATVLVQQGVVLSMQPSDLDRGY